MKSQRRFAAGMVLIATGMFLMNSAFVHEFSKKGRI